MRYLDPKADLTFKRVFGEHPDLVMSFLNALLPLNEGEEITDIEYLSPEIVPDHPLRKNSIVDVRCKDRKGRLFIVEMQMIWSPEYQQRVLFNASKAYVRQLGKKEEYKLLQPVYSLNLINEIFEPALDGYYHYYKMVHVEHTEKVIDGLHLIFVELPKFASRAYQAKKMQVLWLRYLTEISEETREVPQELLENPEVKKAVNALEESAFTDAQLLGYDDFWDIIRTEITRVNSAERRGMERGMEKGMEEGMEKGMEEGMKEGIKEGMKEGMEKGRKEGMEKGMEKGRKEGMEEGREEEKRTIARNLKQIGATAEMISNATGLSAEEIAAL